MLVFLLLLVAEPWGLSCDGDAQSAIGASEAVELQDEATRQWAFDHYESCMKSVFGNPEVWASRSWGDLLVCMRIRGEQTLEAQVLAWFDGPNRMAGIEVLMARRLPISEQLFRLRRACPTCTEGGLFGKVEIDRMNPTSEQLHSLLAVMRRLRDLEVRAVPNSSLIIHGSTYDLWAKALVNTYQYHFWSFRYQPVPTWKVDPLEQWCLDVLECLKIDPRVKE